MFRKLNSTCVFDRITIYWEATPQTIPTLGLVRQSYAVYRAATPFRFRVDTVLTSSVTFSAQSLHNSKVTLRVGHNRKTSSHLSLLVLTVSLVKISAIIFTFNSSAFFIFQCKEVVFYIFKTIKTPKVSTTVVHTGKRFARHCNSATSKLW